MAGYRMLKDPFSFNDFLEFIEGDWPDLTYDAAKILFDHIAERWYEPVAVNDDGSFLYQHKESHASTAVVNMPLRPRAE